MGKSQETFNKKEKEKKRLKKKQDKEVKKQERKANAGSGGLDDMIAYVDEFGNITSTPPDMTKKQEIEAEDIELGVPKREAEEIESVRTGIVSFFNDAKGFGFIRDLETQESVFVHVNALSAPIAENNKVTFEVEQGPKGLNAVNVTLVK
jgi:cold shock CspA family protein